MNSQNAFCMKRLAAGLLVLVLSGCTTTNLALRGGPKPVAAETKVAASGDILKALDGGLVTRLLGASLSRGDRNTALQNEYRALEYTAPGEAVLWQGSSVSGRIIPSQPYRVGSQDCRQYEHTISERAAESTVRGTACRNADGSWSLLS